MSRSGTVDTTPERAWSLLVSPAAYSLKGMFGFVFELPVRPAASGRLFFTVGSGGGRGTAWDQWQATRTGHLTARLARYKALIDGPELPD